MTDFVFLSTDEVLVIHDLEPGSVRLAHWDGEVVEDIFLEGLFVDGEFTDECKTKIAMGEAVLRLDCHAILEQTARLTTDTVSAAQALASIDGIETFRFWDDTRPLATVLHALAAVDASEESIASAIRTLHGAGVPLEQEGKELRFGNGVGTALHVAIVLGNANAARAFAGAGADVNVGRGRLMKLVLDPLEYMAEHPDRSSAEAKRELIERAQVSVALATELGYRPVAELRAVAQRSLSAIEKANDQGRNRR